MRHLLSILPKPSRYVGVEEGSVHKNKSNIDLHIALAFPDMYEVGMSYLGHKILSDIINSKKNWWAERVFTPCKEAGKILKEHNCQLATLESDTSLCELDAIGFAITHELCYTNVLYMLDLAHIPLWFHERQKEGAKWPLIIAGGGCTLAAEPLAPFVDVMLLGEGEETLPNLLALLEQSKKESWSRSHLLLAASKSPGVYVPSFFAENPNVFSAEKTSAVATAPYLIPVHTHHTKSIRQIVADMDNAPYPARQAIPFGAVHSRLALEIGRGCTRGCRFCQAGSIYRPARERSVPNLQYLLESCLNSTGFDDVSFLSLSTGDFSALKELFMSTVDRCAKEQVSVSLPSLRVGSIDDSIMERMAGIRRTGATLAPEAGSQRLRNVINKGITEEELILHVQKLFEHGWEQVKLYFMIGLPTETDEDILSILDLCKKARDAAGPGIKRLQVTAALSPFVPKPHTPFQWEPQISLEEIRRRVGLLLTAVKGEKRIKIRWHEPEMSALEGIFSRGDRRLAPVVESAYKKGAIFCSWMDHMTLAPWLEALKEHGLTPEKYTRGRSIDEPLPWDHLESGLSKDFFHREMKRALQEKTTSDCRYTTCHACGACDTSTTASLLRPLKAEGTPLIANVLNNPQRDQNAHVVAFDQYGRVIPKYAIGKTDGEKKIGKKKPSSLPEHLCRKVDNLRFWYQKQGTAVFLSQLELQDIFNRALRRAKVPLTFSQGFHPMPLISFGRAMPVGVASDCEWFSVIVSEHLPLQKTLTEINKGIPQGLAITSIESLPINKKNADAPFETYHIELIGSNTEKGAFAEAWNKVDTMSHISWERKTKRGVRDLDARSYLVSICPQADNSVTLSFSWETLGYVSPLALSLHVLEAAGMTLSLPQILLTKIGQEGI